MTGGTVDCLRRSSRFVARRVAGELVVVPVLRSTDSIQPTRAGRPTGPS